MNTLTFFLKINKSILNSFLAVLLIQTLSFGQQVSTYAGFGFGGMDGLLGTCAEFSGPNGIVTDNNGIVYVADTDNHSIRKIAIDGYVTTIAGNGTPGYADGIGSDARFNYPTGIAIDDLGNLLIADAGNNRIRKIASDGTVTTIAGDGQMSVAICISGIDGSRFCLKRSFRSRKIIAFGLDRSVKLVKTTGNVGKHHVFHLETDLCVCRVYCPGCCCHNCLFV